MTARQEVIQNRTALDIQKTFATDSGQKALDALSKKCREHVATYVAGDSHHTAYYEGMRSVIIWLRIQLAKNINEEKQKEAVNE